jgi:hypothetical protein
MKRNLWTGLLAAGVLAGGFATSASAADLGGNCCADLEERIAELEATTARKGNRKVSLTVSGFVAQQILAWDDGAESNVYITDTGSVSIGTHVKFTGQATIAPGWTAGYALKIEAIQNDSLLVNAGADNGISGNAQAAIANGSSFVNGLGLNNSGLAVESSYWFVKSDQLGRLSLGKQSSAADNQAILPDGSGSLVVANYVMYDVNAFAVRNGAGGSGPTWGSLASCAPLNGTGGVAGDCDGYPNNNIRYDSPTFAGFSVSASWGEDDIWAVSGRYSGEHSGVKYAMAVAYNESTDENGPGVVLEVNGPAFDASAVQVGGYLEHVATGLFLYGAYAHEYIDTPGNFKPEGDMWYLKAGLRTRISSLGHSVFYGEVGEKNDMMSTNTFAVFGATGSELQQFGLGVVQEVDAAAMSLWLSWRHYEADFDCRAASTCAGFTATGTEDMDIVKAGALINF